MDKFRDVVIKVSENAEPHQKIFIQDQLNKFTSQFRVPDHPTYAAMIHNAIRELNQKRGSSERSISRYIQKEYTNLPFAHNSLLKHHLAELCASGEVVLTRWNLYTLVGFVPTPRPKEKKQQKRKRVSRNGREDKVSDKETDELTVEHFEMNGYNINNVAELNGVVKPTTRHETGMVGQQSRPDLQQAPAVSAPVVDSDVKVNYHENLNLPGISTPERPPGFEFAVFQSEQDGHLFEMPNNAERLSESKTLQQVDEQCRRGQVNGEYPLSECPMSAPSPILSELLRPQHQHQHAELSNSEGLQGVKSKDVMSVQQYPQQIKQYGRRKQLKSRTQDIETEDVAEAEQIMQKKHLDLSDLGKSNSSRGKTQEHIEVCEENKKLNFQFCGEKQALNSELSDASRHQHENMPLHPGRGRPLKLGLGTLDNQKQYQQDQPSRRGRGRHTKRKSAEDNSNSVNNSQNNSQNDIQHTAAPTSYCIQNSQYNMILSSCKQPHKVG